MACAILFILLLKLQMNPANMYLPGLSHDAQWMLNPSEEDNFSDRPPRCRSRFSADFMIAAPPPHTATVFLSAAQQHLLYVNGELVPSSTPAVSANWKRGQTYDLRTHLRSGKNRIDILVTNYGFRTALLVQGSIIQQPPYSAISLTSDSHGVWRVADAAARRSEFAKPFVVPTFIGGSSGLERFRLLYSKDFVPTRLQAGPGPRIWRLYRVVVPLWLSLCFAVALKAILGKSSVPRDDTQRTRNLFALLKRRGLNHRVMAVIVVSLAWAVLQLHNVASFPSTSGFDAPYHIAYVKHVVEQWTVPYPHDGFEMYHPPLYYFLSALVYKCADLFSDQPLRWVQCMALFSSMAILGVIYWTGRQCTALGGSGRLFSLVVAAFVPMHLYMTPMVSNELFSAALQALALASLLQLNMSPTYRNAVLLGLTMGAALLGKFSAGLLLATVLVNGVVKWLQHRPRREVLMLAIAVGIALMLSWWFYLRNLLMYGRLFPFNFEPDLFPFLQHPGYRTADFYTDALNLLYKVRVPGWHPSDSFAGGTYTSMWATDFMHAPIRALDLLDTGVFHLGFVVLLGCGLGSIMVARRALGKGAGSVNIYCPLLVLTVLNLASYAYYTLKAPMFSVVKANFLLPALVPMAVLTGLGLERMCSTGITRGFVWTAVGCLVSLSVLCSWYVPH